MSKHVSFIPPDIVPPEPPGLKTLGVIFSIAMSLFFIVFIGFICIDFLSDFFPVPMPYDVERETMIQEEYGPFISNFLGLDFPGQYAPMFGKNARLERYLLTKEEQTLAIYKLQSALQQAENVTVKVTIGTADPPSDTAELPLSYDADLASELCMQTDSAEYTSISPLDNRLAPELVFTFYPSEIKVNMTDSTSTPSIYITWGNGKQRWEGFFGGGFASALLNAKLKSGETIGSLIADQTPHSP